MDTCPLLFYHYPIQLIYLPLTSGDVYNFVTNWVWHLHNWNKSRKQPRLLFFYFLPTIMSSRIKGRLLFISIFNVKLKIFLILLKTHHTSKQQKQSSKSCAEQCQSYQIYLWHMEFSQKRLTAPHVATKSKTNHTFLSTHLKLSLTKLTY